jgi:adhesin transport system membrane fusion protein
MSQPIELPREPKPRSLARRAIDAMLPAANDTEYMRESSAALMEGPRFFSHWLLWLTLLFFACALAWAALTEVDEFAVGEGKVIPSSQVQVVQNLEGGIVSEILVRIGDKVKKDQPLMRIDDTRFARRPGQGPGAAGAHRAARGRSQRHGLRSPGAAG